MVFSNHALKKQRQRGISNDCIELVLQLGKPIERPGNAVEYRIPKKDRPIIIKEFKHKLNELEKAFNVGILTSESDGEIITVLHPSH